MYFLEEMCTLKSKIESFCSKYSILEKIYGLQIKIKDFSANGSKTENVYFEEIQKFIYHGVHG